LEQNFVEEEIIMKYFNFEELITKLGGIGASIQIVLGSVGFIFMIQFSYAISAIIHRKYLEKLRLYEIQKMET